MCKASSHTRARCHPGFTLVELLVVIGIIALLISILLPALQSARESANVAACLSNQRQLAVGMNLYAHDHKGQMPTIFYLGYPLSTHMDINSGGPIGGLGLLYDGKYIGANGAILYCPSVSAGGLSYEENSPAFAGGPPLKAIPGKASYSGYNYRNPYSEYVMPAESGSSYASGRLDKMAKARRAIVMDNLLYITYPPLPSSAMGSGHRKKSVVNLAFADGHAESFIDSELMKSSMNELQANTYLINSAEK